MSEEFEFTTRDNLMKDEEIYFDEDEAVIFEKELSLSKKKEIDIQKEDLVRIMIHTLQTLNYNEAAKALEKESELTLYSVDIEQFRSFVLNGQWEEVHHHLHVLKLTEENDQKMVKLLLYTQEFLELLELGKQREAITLLQQKLSKVAKNRQTMQSLTCLLMCMTPEDLRYRAKWEGAGRKTRLELLHNIENHVSPKLLLPKDRLLDLLHTGLYHERQHNILLPEWGREATRTYSIFNRQISIDESLPTLLSQQILIKDDELWHICFSSDGQFMVVGSKSGMITIYKLQNTRWEIYRTENHHGKIFALEFSPNDEKLAIISGVGKIWILNMNSDHEKYFLQVDNRVIAANGLKWINNDHLLFWISNSLLIYQFSSSQVINKRIFYVNKGLYQCVQVTEKYLIFSTQKRIFVYDLQRLFKPQMNTKTANSPKNLNHACIIQHHSENHIMEVKISPCGDFLLASYSRIDSNNGNGMLECFRIRSDHLESIRTYEGYSQLRYRVGYTFGGYGSHLIVSGSENGKLYFWSRDEGKLLAQLDDHHSCTNDIAWHPSQRMMATISDDLRINVYTIPTLK
mmetsp:Transcript_1328/g.1987  ORF Transcript_1328/g.1987 Transcript_1328/m.1987 type:complete len:573 (-) Transcript_1328:59-1777(-)